MQLSLQELAFSRNPLNLFRFDLRPVYDINFPLTSCYANGIRLSDAEFLAMARQFVIIKKANKFKTNVKQILHKRHPLLPFKHPQLHRLTGWKASPYFCFNGGNGRNDDFLLEFRSPPQ